MYVLITANRNYSSWSLRPWVLMKTLDIPFVDEIQPFAAPVNYEVFRAFSPTGQVPALIDGERVIWDSLGITLYLADRYPAVWPDAVDARAQRVRHGVVDHARVEQVLDDGCDRRDGQRVAHGSPARRAAR